MKKRIYVNLLTSLLLVLTLPARAVDLVTVYAQALCNDPTFKKAEADWESAKENLPLARAAYLTQIAIVGAVKRQYNRTNLLTSVPSADIGDSSISNFVVGNVDNYTYGFGLNITQPIFNLATWKAIKGAKASVKSATATYASASQDLMLRTVTAYINVLQAYDQLRYTLARKRYIKEQLVVAEQQFKVGTIAITGVYDALAAYDQAVADEITDRNQLDDTLEELREITGFKYSEMCGIGKQVPLITPEPNNIDQWAHLAMRQNYSLIAQNYAVEAAREKIKQQAATWLPTLNADFSYTNENQSPDDSQEGIQTQNALYGLSLNFPIVQGGAVIASTRQARYDYLSSSSQREYICRSVVSQTRQSFLNVVSGISKIKADKQSVVSQQKDLEATKVGYEVGTRTMTDVLNEITSLYQSQQAYSSDQYQYVESIIQLKYEAGTLNVDDLRAINCWLDRNYNLGKPTVVDYGQTPAHKKINQFATRKSVSSNQPAAAAVVTSAPTKKRVQIVHHKVNDKAAT